MHWVKSARNFSILLVSGFISNHFLLLLLSY